MTSNPDIRGILLDIEGTTTPIAFVHEVLFPYARSRVKSYLAVNSQSSDTIADLAQLRKEHALDVQQGLEPPALVDRPQEAEIDSIVDYVHWQIDHDPDPTGAPR